MTRVGFTTVLASNGAEAIEAVTESGSYKHEAMGTTPRFDVILVCSLSFRGNALLIVIHMAPDGPSNASHVGHNDKLQTHSTLMPNL